MTRCNLGREEYGGDRYCFEHGGFQHLYGVHWCDKSPAALAERERREQAASEHPPDLLASKSTRKRRHDRDHT